MVEAINDIPHIGSKIWWRRKEDEGTLLEGYLISRRGQVIAIGESPRTLFPKWYPEAEIDIYHWETQGEKV